MQPHKMYHLHISKSFNVCPIVNASQFFFLFLSSLIKSTKLQVDTMAKIKIKININMNFLNCLIIFFQGEYIMAKLTTKQRNELPSKEFALPEERKYPIFDRSHAINAKARAQQQYDKGLISIDVLHRIDAKANKKI